MQSCIFVATAAALLIFVVFLFFAFAMKLKPESCQSKLNVCLLFLSTVISISALIPATGWQCLSLSYDTHEVGESVFVVSFALQSQMSVFVLFVKARDVFAGKSLR